MHEDPTLLLVEDDEVDVISLRRAATAAEMQNRIDVVSSGVAALERLRDATNPPPKLIVLDLNLPLMSGLELLTALKADPGLRRIPVVMLTTSDREIEIRSCYSAGAAGYFVKPRTFARFVETMRAFRAYWTISRLPDDAIA